MSSDEEKEEREDVQLSRRRFLTRATTGTAAALLLPGLSAAQEHGAHAAAPSAAAAAEVDSQCPAFPPELMVNHDSPPQPRTSGSFVEPDEAEIRDGVLLKPLRVTKEWKRLACFNEEEEEIGGARIVCVRSFSQSFKVPGPTIRVKPGQTLKLRYINELPRNVNPGHPKDPNVPHHFNTTNLHTHGFHVSPRFPGDDALIEIPPKAEATAEKPYFRDYAFQIPSFHPPGTHWYHPHKHGSTEAQVRNGMAGALIIEETEEHRVPPQIHNAPQKILILQSVEEMEEKPQLMLKAMDLNIAEDFTVNGVQNPTLPVNPGRIERWRIINAQGIVNGYVALQLNGAELYHIAMDGLFMPTMKKITTPFLLAPGNRADFLVLIKEPGIYGLDTVGFDRTENQVPAQRLATVRVDGERFREEVDGDMPPVPEYLRTTLNDEIAVTRRLCFTKGMTLNNLKFAADRVDQCMTLGTTEEWILKNVTGGDHPYHIHVNPFEVFAEEGKPGRWQDTVNIPPGQEVRMRMRIRNFTGPFVLHCHILTHEDRGMMQLVEVKDKGCAPPGNPTCNP